MAKGVAYVACTGDWNAEFQSKKGKGHVEDMAVVGKVILKQILQEQVVMMRVSFKKLTEGKLSGLL
jgi:hypothetical protein